MLLISDYEKYLDIVKNYVDQNWLNKEIEKIKTYYKTPKNARILGNIEDFTKPLAFLIFQAESQINENRISRTRFISNELIVIIRLGLYIEILASSNVEGFKEKLVELTNSNKDQFEKIVFELDIASSFVKSGHRVTFLKTDSVNQKRSPDLLVDNTIEVECKKKDKLTKRDRQNNEHWNFLQRKFINMMNDLKKFYLIHLYFEQDLNSKLVKEVIRKIRKLINSGSEGEFYVDSVKITIYKICDFGENFLLPIRANNQSELMSQLNPDLFHKIIETRIPNPDLLDYVKQKPDFDSTNPRLTRFQNGEVTVGEIMKFVFKTKDEPDRLKSIIKSISDAKNQFSGSRISIICVNLTNISEKMIDVDLERLGKMIESVLNNNSSISAVAVTSETHIKEKNGIRFFHKASVIRNKIAKNPLPENFVILN